MRCRVRGYSLPFSQDFEPVIRPPYAPTLQLTKLLITHFCGILDPLLERGSVIVSGVDRYTRQTGPPHKHDFLRTQTHCSLQLEHN
jgi:hypothetical protein